MANSSPSCHGRRTAPPVGAFVLALQRSAGNRAVSRLLQRRPVGDGSRATGIAFTVGVECSPEFARAAKRAVADGVVDERDLGELRQAALADDASVSDDERMFMAALLDPANVALLRSRMFAAGGDEIVFAIASIGAASRARIADTGRMGLPGDVAAEGREVDAALAHGDLFAAGVHQNRMEEHAARAIDFTFGRWLPTARATLTRGRRSGLFATHIVRAMNAAASDSTEGDRALAGAVYVIAAETGSPLQDDILAGRLKVDETSMPLPLGAFAIYSSAGNALKGDTIYLPSTFDIEDLAHRAAVVHELQHAADDRASGGPRVRADPTDQGELRGYRAQARYLLYAIVRLRGAERSAAITAAAREYNLVVGLAAALEARSDRARLEPIVRALNAAAPLARNQLSEANVSAALRRPVADVEAEALRLIRLLYRIDAAQHTTIREGLSGESLLDWINRPR